MWSNRLYYTIQAFRRGVTRAMVWRVSELLDDSWPRIRRRIQERMEANYDVEGESGFEWLSRQPVRTKSDYLQGAGSNVRPSLTFSEVRRTSGSSGKPFIFERDRRMTAWMDAAMWAAYGWYGIRPGDRMARFWGRPLSGMEALTRRFKDRLLRQRRMNAFDVSLRESDSFFDELTEWNPKYAYGYPTLIREFVEHLRKVGRDGRKLELEVVITTGELLDTSTRQSLRAFFGCPVADEYGCSESGILAFECPEGTSHVIPVAACIQVGEAGPDARTVREGPVRVTDLYGSVMPFVKYELDDTARLYPPGACECGRSLPELEVLAGRRDSFIRTPEGDKIYDAVLAYSVPDEVAQFQVQQSAVDKLEGRIVVREDHDPARVMRKCRRRWNDALDADISIELRLADRIEPESSGKRRYFVPLDDA